MSCCAGSTIGPRMRTALAGLLAARKAHVNLIPYNPVAGLPFERPSPAAIRRFVEIVRSRGVSVSVRKTKGREIDAACGQLRRRLEEPAPERDGGGGGRDVAAARVAGVPASTLSRASRPGDRAGGSPW